MNRADVEKLIDEVLARERVASREDIPEEQVAVARRLAEEVLPRTVDAGDRRAVGWAVGVLSAPIDDVVDFDPRWVRAHYERLQRVGYSELNQGGRSALMRAVTLLDSHLGRDAQQDVGRMPLEDHLSEPQPGYFGGSTAPQAVNAWRRHTGREDVDLSRLSARLQLPG